MRPLRVRKTHLSAYKGGNSAWNEGGAPEVYTRRAARVREAWAGIGESSVWLGVCSRVRRGVQGMPKPR